MWSRIPQVTASSEFKRAKRSDPCDGDPTWTWHRDADNSDSTAAAGDLEMWDVEF